MLAATSPLVRAGDKYQGIEGPTLKHAAVDSFHVPYLRAR